MIKQRYDADTRNPSNSAQEQEKFCTSLTALSEPEMVIVATGRWWCLSFGWIGSTLDVWGYRKTITKPEHINTLYFHSLEAALKHPSRGSWWEITSPDGQVVVSSYSGIDDRYKSDTEGGEGGGDPALPSLSLCARQILNTRYPGSYPESIEVTDTLDRLGSDLVSHDDGVMWEMVLLGAGSDASRNGTKPKPPRPRHLSILSVDLIAEKPVDKIVIRHASGTITIRVDALEIRASKSSHSLHVTDPTTGRMKGVIASEIAGGVVAVLEAYGVRVDKPHSGISSARLIKTWKPGLFKVQQKIEGEVTYCDVKGFVRGNLGIDRRTVEVTGGWGEHTYTYKALLWHLTHIPTGLLIAQYKRRVDAEGLADLLRERVEELTDGECDPFADKTIGARAQAALDEYAKGDR